MDNYFLSITVMVLLVAASAFFSATETAFSTLNKTRIKTLAEQGNRRAAIALNLADHFDQLISTILIGNNIVNISLATVATMFFVNLFGPSLGATYATIIITIVVLIFGEISPKSIAKDCPESFALFAAPVMRLLVWILFPVNRLFSWWKAALSRVLKIKNRTKRSQAELLMLVDEVEQEGSIDTEEGQLLKNAIEFTDRRADEILTPRVDIEAVPANASKELVAAKFAETKYSRLPVYEGNIDNIVGVIHQKDFYTGSGITGKRLKDIITTPTFVHKTAKISELLRQLQSAKSHVAVVLDEYGGTFGIVTMEDILEELVGDIWDEHDEIIDDFRKIADNLYSVDASIYLEDFCEFFKIKTNSDVVSVSGWVMEVLGTIPSIGDSFTYDTLEITVTELDNRRIARIQVRIIEKQTIQDK